MNSVSKKGDGVDYVYALQPTIDENGKANFGENNLDARILEKLFGDGKAVANFFTTLYFDSLKRFSMEVAGPFVSGAIEYRNKDYKDFSNRIFETLNSLAEQKIENRPNGHDSVYQDSIITDIDGNFRGLLELQKIGDKTNYIVATNPEFLNLESVVESFQNPSQE